jgi:RalA-binding protein 1
MSLLNIGIVFALTLGIPGSILNMLLTEFDYVFWTNDEEVPLENQNEQDDRPTHTQDKMDALLPEATKADLNLLTVIQGNDQRSNRNSMIFSSGAPNAIKHIEKNLDSKLWKALPCSYILVCPH